MLVLYLTVSQSLANKGILSFHHQGCDDDFCAKRREWREHASHHPCITSPPPAAMEDLW
jgi:hypothetical protein